MYIKYKINLKNKNQIFINHSINFLKQITYIFILLCFTTQLIPSNKDYSFDHISSNNGLSQNSIFSLLQDNKGFIWIATLDGLNRFDGKNFVIYKHNPDNRHSLSQSIVWSLLEDKNGNLWIGTIRGGLNRFDRKTETFFCYKKIKNNKESLSDNNIISLFEDSKSNLWIGTLNGLNLLKKNKFKRFINDPSDPNTISGSRINDIIEDQNGFLWLGSDGGLNKFNKTTGKSIVYKKLNNKKNSIRNHITSLCIDNSGYFWIGTRSEGLYRFYEDKNQFKRLPLYKDGIKKNISPITSITEINKNELWVTIDGDGIKIIKNQKFTDEIKPDISNTNSLNSFSILNSYIDKNGNIWIGTNNNGINLYNPNRKKFNYNSIPISNEKKKKYNCIWGFSEESKEILWIATEGGLVKYLYDSEYNKFSLKSDSPNLNLDIGIRSFLIDKKGIFWIGTLSNGLYIFDRIKNKFIKFKFPNLNNQYLENARIVDLFEDKDENLWISVFEKGLIKLNAKRDKMIHYLHNPKDEKSIASNLSYKITEDSFGNIWFATLEGGLNKYDPKKDKFKKYINIPGDNNSINSNTVYAIYINKNNIIWIGTQSGFCKFNPTNETFTRYSKEAGFNNTPVYEIIEDDKNKIWIAGNNLTMFDPINNNFNFFNNRDGLQSGEFNTNAILKSKYRKNIIYFGGTSGYNEVDTVDIKKNTFTPPVYFTKIKINGKELKPRKNSYLEKSLLDIKKISFPYHINNISLEFIALDYSNPSTNKYAYKIKGINKDWIHLGNSSEIILTNLIPGNYDISVRGSNNDGVWNNKGATLKIIITPPIWLTWWFKSFLVLLIIIVLYLIIKKIKKRIESKYKKIDAVKNLYIEKGISKREKEIIELILQGKNNKEIEKQLFISIKTVNNHKYNIFKKLNVNSSGDLKYLIKMVLNNN